MRCKVFFMFLTIGYSSIASSTAPIRRLQLFSTRLVSELAVGRARQNRPRLSDVSFIPRGGGAEEEDEDVADGSLLPVSEAANASLVTEIAGDADVESTSPNVIASPQITPPPPPRTLTRTLANLKERTLPAVLMLAVLGTTAKFLKEDGLIYLTLLLQGGMYQETTRVIGGDFPHAFFKWWWFVTGSVALNGPRMFSWASTKVTAGATGMAIMGIVAAVLRMHWKGADVEEFRDLLRQAAVSFLATLLVVLPSSYWVATLEEFGMKWVALPAALVIINDTFAYFFGIAFGKHKLLPVISPSKTWEGFLGATFSTCLAAYFLISSKQDAIFLSLAASLVGPFGGFLASLIKRAYAQKDFGSLFPGHGGLVDRLDCQLIMAPLVFFYRSLVVAGTTTN